MEIIFDDSEDKRWSGMYLLGLDFKCLLLIFSCYETVLLKKNSNNKGCAKIEKEKIVAEELWLN